jgi:Lrp/AsnC family leucine-responsive transcriptional regulator
MDRNAGIWHTPDLPAHRSRIVTVHASPVVTARTSDEQVRTGATESVQIRHTDADRSGGARDVDTIDVRIVELLRYNARVSIAELARKVGLSPPAVHERVAKLEQSRVIRAYRADVAPEAMGLGITALVGIVQSARADEHELVNTVERFHEVEACYFVAGEESFMLKVRVSTVGDLERLILRLTKIDGVERTRTTIVLSTKWEDRPRPSAEIAAPSESSALPVD